MAIRPMPADNGAGAPSPRDHFAEYVNKNNYIPLWAAPHVARGILKHFAGDGSVIVHPHPSTGYGMPGYLGGGVATAPTVEGGPTFDRGSPMEGGVGLVQQPPVGRMPPGGPPSPIGRMPPGQMPPGLGRAPFGPRMAPPAPLPRPLAGISPDPALARSIFAGGQIGANAPADRTPLFVQRGGAIDARPGGKVPGKDMGRDSVHAMLEPGEMVANKKQLRGIQVKPGKSHLLRSDQKKAIKQAHKRDARRQ